MNSKSLEILVHQIAYASRGYGGGYNSFPSAVITPSGEILVSFRQARMFPEQTHIDVSSHAMLLRSVDGGKTFSASLLKDEVAEGIQDPSINLLSDGTLLLTYFTWYVQQRQLTTGIEDPRWLSLGKDHVARIGGLYTIRSYDGGRTWDERTSVSKAPIALRGKGVELANGDFLIASYDCSGVVSIHRTADQGKSWELFSAITHPEGLSETSLLRTASGKLIAWHRAQRCHPEDPSQSPLLTSESLDDGKTWSTPVLRPFFSFSPFEARRLKSGKVLVTYGYRYAPFGIRAFLLDAECNHWEQAHEIVLRDDGLSYDLGYTSAAQLPNNDILIFYYYHGKDQYRYIGVSRCREVEG